MHHLEPAIPDTYLTLVLLGRSRELGPVVIKSSSLAEEFRAEATALRLAEAGNAARLYDVDLERSAMVIERIVPGTQLRNIAMTDVNATRLAAEMMRSFWRPVSDPTDLHPLRKWVGALLDWTPQPGAIPNELVSHAQSLAEDLLGSTTDKVLLHGDFQHYNLLQRASGDWAIIDPKGVYGSPGFDIGAWMYNPEGVTDGDSYLALAAERLAIFADVWQMPQEELARWSFVAAVHNACRCTTDAALDELVHHCVKVAEQLQTLLVD